VDNAQRLKYLEAMGIDVWIPRQFAPSHLELQSAAITSGVEAQPISVPVSDDWDTLSAEVATCKKCGLCSARKNTVFGSGNKNADWLFIGEGPGQHEDEQGLPFVGNAGQLLTEMIRALGLNREDVFITNIVKCRPPNNRDPHVDEVASCHNYLQRQITFIQPKIILAVGRIAAQTLLNSDAPMSKLRGKVHRLNRFPVIVIYHPAYLLRSLLEKRKAWQDLQFAKKTFQKEQ